MWIRQYNVNWNQNPTQIENDAMEHKWGKRKMIILFAKDEREYVHDCWKRSKRRANGIKTRSFLSRQKRKFGWWFYIWTSFQPSLLLWCCNCPAYFQLPTRSKFYKHFFVLKSNRKKHKHSHVENVWNYMWKHLLNCECRSFNICITQLIVI
jgi:hypothetical protein